MNKKGPRSPLGRGIVWKNGTAYFEKWIGGERRRKKISNVHRAAEVRAAFDQWVEEITNPAPMVKAPVASATETFEQYVTRWWPMSRDPRKPLDPQTAERELYMIEARLYPYFGKMQFEIIGVNTVEDFGAKMLNDNLRPASVNALDRILHKICAHAFRRGDRTVPALKAWPMPLPVKKVNRSITPKEAEKFLSAFEEVVISGGAAGEQGSRYYTSRFQWAAPIFVLGMTTGLAKSDLLGLKWAEVDLTAKLIRRSRNKTSVEAEIELCDRALEALVVCKTRSVVHHDLVFCTPEGDPFSPVTFRKYFLVATKHAGIKSFRPHDMRHTFSSLLGNAGVDPWALKGALGWSSVKMADTYTHRLTRTDRPVAAALNSLFPA